MQCVQEFEYFAVFFTVKSVGVRQLCLRRIGVRSQKSLKTAVNPSQSYGASPAPGWLVIPACQARVKAGHVHLCRAAGNTVRSRMTGDAP